MRLARAMSASLRKLYSPAGARLADLWPMALLDGGAHHGFGVRRGTPLVVVWLGGEGFSVQAFVCAFVVVHGVAGHRFVC